MHKIIKITILLIFLFVIGIFYLSLTRDTNYNTSSLINKDTPEFQVISFDESNFYTRDDIKKNNYTLINFWASWCAPCRIEHPILMKLSQKKNLMLLGINFKDKELQAKTFLGELGNPYDLLAKDKNGKHSVKFGIYGIPESILINKEFISLPIFPETFATLVSVPAVSKKSIKNKVNITVTIEADSAAPKSNLKR